MTDLNQLYDDFTQTGTTITFDEFSEGMKDEGFKSFVDTEVGELKKKDNSQPTDPLTTEMPTNLPQDFSVPMGSETDLPLLEQQKEDSMLGTGEIPTSTELASQPMASLSEESQSNSTALQQATEGDSAKGLPKVVNPITNAPKSVKPTTPTVPAMPKAVTEVTPITKKDTALKELALGEDEVEEPVIKADKYISTQTEDTIFQIPKERLEVAGMDAEGNTFFNTKDGKFQMIYKDGILQSPVRESIVNADGSSTELPPKVYGKDFFVTKEGYIRFADEMPENKTTTDYKLSIPPFDEFIEDTLSKDPVLANDAVLAKEKEGKVAIKKDINGNLLTNDDGEYIWKYTDKELYDQEVEKIKAHNAGNGLYDNEVNQNRSDYAKNNQAYNELLQGAQVETEVKNEAIRLLGDEIAKKYSYAPSQDEIDAELLQLRANQIAASGNYTPEQAAQIASQEKEAAMQSDRKVSSDIAFQFLQQAEKVSRGEDRSTNKKFEDDLKLTDSEKAVWQSLASDPEFGKWYNTYGVKLFGDAETGLITNASTTTLRKRVVDTYMNFRQSELSDRISVIDRARGNQKKMDVVNAFESGDLNKIESARSERTPVLQAQQGIVAKFQALGVRSGEYNRGFDILYARDMKTAEEFAGYKNNDAGDKAIVTAKNIANGLVNVAADIVGGVVVLPSLFSETAKNYASAYDYSTKNAFDVLNEGMTDKFKEYSKDGSTVKVYNGRVFNVGKDGSLKYNEGLTNSQSALNDWKFVKEDSEVNMAGVARTFSNQIPMMMFPELMAGRLAAVKSGRMLKNMINVANLAGKESLIGKNILAFARSPKDAYSALLWGEQVMKSNVIAGQEAGLSKEGAFLYGVLQSAATMSLLKISPDAKFFGEYKAVNRDVFKLISQGKYDVAKRTFFEGMKKLGKSNFGEMGQEEIERNTQNLINQTFNTVLGDNKDGSKKFSTGNFEEFTQTWQETGVITTGLEAFNMLSGRGRLKLKGNSNLQNHILASLIPEFESQYLDSVEQSSWTGVTSKGTAETRAKLKKIREYTNQIPPNTELHLSETEQYVISMQTIEDLQKKKDAASDVLADQYDAKIAEEKAKIDGLFEMANERKNSKSNEDTASTDEAPETAQDETPTEETAQDETPTAETAPATDKPINPEDNGGGSAEFTPEEQPKITFNGIEFTAIVGDKLLTGSSEAEVQSKIDETNTASTPEVAPETMPEVAPETTPEVAPTEESAPVKTTDEINSQRDSSISSIKEKKNLFGRKNGKVTFDINGRQVTIGTKDNPATAEDAEYYIRNNAEKETIKSEAASNSMEDLDAKLKGLQEQDDALKNDGWDSVTTEGRVALSDDEITKRRSDISDQMWIIKQAKYLKNPELRIDDEIASNEWMIEMLNKDLEKTTNPEDKKEIEDDIARYTGYLENVKAEKEKYNESKTSKQEESGNDGTAQSPEGINDQTDDTVSQTEQDQDTQDQATEEVTDDELAAIDAELEALKKSQNDNGKSTETSDADGNTEPTGGGIQQTEQGQNEGNQQEIPTTTDSTTSQGENELNSDEYSLNNKTYTRKPDGTYTTKDKNGVERPVAKKETIAALEEMYDERNLAEKTEKDGYTLKRYNDGTSKITTPKGTVVSSKIIRTRKANKRERKNGVRGDVDAVIRNPNFSKIMQEVFGEESEFTISNERKQRLKEALQFFIPTNEREIAMLYFAEGGKVSAVSIGSEILGNSKDGNNERGRDKSTAEFQWAYFGKVKQNESFETLAEKLMEDYGDLGIDANDLRSALIDVVTSYSGVIDIQEEILNLYNQSVDPYFGMTEQDAYEMYKADLSPSQLAQLEANEAMDSLTDQELIDLYFNSINSLSYEQQDELYNGKTNTTRNEGIQSKSKDVPSSRNESKTDKRQSQKPEVKTSPEYVAIEKEIEEAENETRIAKEALDKKAKELDKGLLDDQEDLFGERKSQQNPTMFDERATSEARDNAIAPFKKRYENAKDKVRKLKDQRDQLTGENTTGEIDFDAEQKPSTTKEKPAPKKSSSTSTKKEPKAKKTVIRDTALQDEIRKQAEAFRKTLGQLNSGVNPQTVIEGSKLVALYVKGGVYKFADIVKDIHGNIFKVSEDILKGLRAAYGAYRENADQDVYEQMDSSTRDVTLADLNDVEDTTEETTEENEKDKKPKESGKKQSSDNGGNDSGKTTKLSDKLNAPDNGSVGGTKGSNSKRPDIVVQANPPKVKNYITGDYEIDESQKAGVNAALDRFDKGGRGFLLADGTGVGKTRQILATAQEFYNKTGKKVLIISQNKTILDNNFAKDAKAMGIDMSIFEAGTYDGIRTGKVGKQKYGLVIYDEAHNLKNSDSEKSIAANNIETDHEMYVTATPMDTFPSAVYFISAVTGLSEEDVYRSLGLNVKSGVNDKGEKVLTVTPQKGVSAEAIRQNLLGIRDRIIDDGGMIRREYPFYGEFQEDSVPLTEDELQEESEIEEYWDAEIDAAIGRKKMNLSAQKSGELSRWNESRKVKYVVNQALKEIKAGRKVVIIAEGVNDTYIKALDKNVKGFVNEAVRRLEEQGITVAKIFGKNDKAIANDQFQDGDAQVVIGTAISASTGIDLDDQVGDTPRTLFMVTSNYSGNVFQQILGRVSRRNTKSPAKIRMIFKESISDGRRKQIVGGKLQTLQAIQNGTIQDDFDITTVPDSGNNPVKEVGDLTLTDYGDKAVAIFGDSRNIKDDLKALGGRFNPKLTDPATGEKKAGWIFPKAKRTELENLIDNREQASKLVMDDSDPDNVFVSESITDYMPSLFPEGNEDAFERELEQEEVKSNNLFNSVKAIWSKDKNLQFTGTTKVQNAADVAEIMKLLENKSVEHAFAVHIDGEGNSHIQFLSIGSHAQTVVDGNIVAAGVAKFGSKKVYLVHNHPSGSMKPSDADLQVTARLRDGLDPLGIELEHVIMDTYKKEYVVIDQNNDFSTFTRTGNAPDVKLETYIMDGQEILGKPIATVSNSRNIFAAIQQHRFSAMPKNAMLVLDQSLNIIGNYILPNGLSYEDIIKNVGESGVGNSVVFYGNQNNIDQVNKLKRQLQNLNIRVLDHIVTNSNNDAVNGFYESMGDQGRLYEDQAKYGTNSISDETFTLREPDNEYTVIAKSNPLPITEIRKALAAAKSSIKEGVETIKDSKWYSKLSDKRKAMVTEQNFIDIIQQSRTAIKENSDRAKLGKDEALKIERDRSKEKLAEQAKTFSEKIVKIKEDFNAKLQKLRETNKDAKNKIAARKMISRQAYNKVIQMLSDPAIKNDMSPSAIKALLRKADRLLNARDTAKVLDEFYDMAQKIEERIGRSKKLKLKQSEADFERYNEIRDIIMDEIVKGTNAEEIMKLFPDANDFDLAKRALNDIKSDDVSIQKALSLVEQAQDESERIVKSRPKEGSMIDKTMKALVDRQYMPKKLLDAINAGTTVDRMINFAGANSRAKHQFDVAYDEIWKGLSNEERKLLDLIITNRRYIAIDENRAMRGIPPIINTAIEVEKADGTIEKINLNGKIAAKAIEALRAKHGNEMIDKLIGRSDKYFDQFKGLLKEMKNSGLISDIEYDNMAEIDYQPRVFLDKMLDFEGNMKDGKDRDDFMKSTGLNAEQIKSLRDGSEASLMMRSEWLLGNAFISRNKAMMINNVNVDFMTRTYPNAKITFEKYQSIDANKRTKEQKRFIKYFTELQSKIKENPITGFNSNGNPEYKYSKVPQGYKTAYYYINGMQHRFLMEETLYNDWHDTVSKFDPDASWLTKTASAPSRIVKFFATGNNPAFALVNTPRDFWHTYNFSSEYSPFLLKGMFDLTKDFIKGIREISRYDKGQKDNLMYKAMEYGVGMDFLNTQGAIERGDNISKVTDSLLDKKIQDKASPIIKKYFLLKNISRYSEVMFRVAIFDRSLKNQLKDYNKKNKTNYKSVEQLDATTKDDMYNAAARSARSVMDFNQGGRVTKDAEAFIPYINAATQGSRVAIQEFAKDPVTVSAKMVQTATLFTSTAIGISAMFIAGFKDDDDERSVWEIYLHAIDGITKRQRTNGMNIVYGYDKETGEYKYFSFAKSQALTPLMNLVENLATNYMREEVGMPTKSWKEILTEVGYAFSENVDPSGLSSIVTNPRQDGVLDSAIKALGKFPAKNPLMKGLMTYLTGYDFFFEQDLLDTNNGTEKRLEGMNSESVENFYKQLGWKAGASPVRTKALVESVFTSPTTNPHIAITYAGLNAISDAFSGEETKYDVEYGIKAVGLNRLLKETTGYARQVNIEEKIDPKLDAIKAEQLDKKMNVDQLANFVKNKKDWTDQEIDDTIAKIEAITKDPEEQEKIIKKLTNKVKNRTVDSSMWNIKFNAKSDEERAYKILRDIGDAVANPEIEAQLKQAGIWTENIQKLYLKYYAEREQEKRKK